MAQVTPIEAGKRPKTTKAKVKEAANALKDQGTPILEGIQDPDKPLTPNDVWEFVKEHAGNNPHNVEIVPLENVVADAPRPLPFTSMDRAGPRAQVMWSLVNGCGEGKCRRLSTFIKEAGQHGASGKRVPDLLAALNGGYSRSSKQWGTPFVMLRVIDEPKHH